VSRCGFYDFFFLPGFTFARLLRALSMSGVDQSRTVTPPTFCSGGASTVRADTCLWRVRRETLSFLAAPRVESAFFMMYAYITFNGQVSNRAVVFFMRG